MGREGKGLAGALFETGTRLVSRAAGAVLEDPRGQEAVARAVGIAQRGRKRLETLQERVMHAAGIPGRQDYQDLAKQVARLKRKARELSERMGDDALRGEDEGAGGSRRSR